jgi:MFS family permease
MSYGLELGMDSNMKKLYLSNFLTGLVFWYGIEKLFMHSIGINNLGIALNAIAYIVVSVIFNIPAGILADKWNRKYTLMLGSLALALSSFLMSRSHGLATYLFATGVWAFYLVLTSGTYQAMTYDSLAERGKESEYVTHQGRSYGMFLVGVSLSSVVGGYIASRYGYRSAYLLTTIPPILNIVVLASMHELAFHKDIEDTKLWQHIQKTYRLITAERLLFYLSMLFVAAAFLNSNQDEYSGLYFIALGFGAIGNGWASAGNWLFESVGQFLSQKLSKYTRFLVPLFFLTFMAFSIFHSPLGLIFFYLATFTQAIVSTNIEGVIQSNTPSSVRATMLSVLGFSSNILLIPTSIIFGYIARHSVLHAYQFIGIIGLVFALIWVLRPKTVKNQRLYATHPKDASLGSSVVST